MEMNRLQEIKKKIDKKTVGDIDGSEGVFGINYKKPLTTPPDNSGQAIVARHLALTAKFNSNDKYLQAEWQRYWLSCCISQRCDYIFAELREIRIDREEDLMNLLEKGILWEHLGSEHGKSYYMDMCIRFLLRRYAWWKACRLWWNHTRKSMVWINLLLPRLFGSIIIGLLVLATAENLWRFPLKMYTENIGLYWSLFGITLLFSLGYLIVECRNTTGEIPRCVIFGRSFLIFVIGFIYGLLLSYFLEFLGPYIVDEEVSCQTTLLFASLALLIGIFIQIFWEEKTITEPL